MSAFPAGMRRWQQWRAAVFEFLFDHIQHRVKPLLSRDARDRRAKIAACTTPDLSAPNAQFDRCRVAEASHRRAGR